MENGNILLLNRQTLTETANFFRFGFGLGDELYVKQYGQFVSDILHFDNTIIDEAIAAWSRIQTKIDAAAAVLLHQTDNIAEYARLKLPFVSDFLKATRFDYADYMNKVKEAYSNDNIYAIKYLAYTYVCDNEIDKAIALYKLSAVWGDLFSIKLCQRYSNKEFWDKLEAIITQDIVLSDNDPVTKVAKSMKLLRLYEYKSETVIRDAVSIILSDEATLSDIDMALRARNFLSRSNERSRIGFTANINTEDQNG